jgi:mRNA degradation ribonuclease J1/J2
MIVEHDADCGEGRLIVEQRLSHPHEDHVGHRAIVIISLLFIRINRGRLLRTDKSIGEPQLTDNLTRRQVARKTLLACRAEKTIDRTSCLGLDT